MKAKTISVTQERRPTAQMKTTHLSDDESDSVSETMCYLICISSVK